MKISTIWKNIALLIFMSVALTACEETKCTERELDEVVKELFVASKKRDALIEKKLGRRLTQQEFSDARNRLDKALSPLERAMEAAVNRGDSSAVCQNYRKAIDVIENTN